MLPEGCKSEEEVAGTHKVLKNSNDLTTLNMLTFLSRPGLLLSSLHGLSCSICIDRELPRG